MNDRGKQITFAPIVQNRIFKKCQHNFSLQHPQMWFVSNVDEGKDFSSILASAILHIDYRIISKKLDSVKVKCPQILNNRKHKNQSQIFFRVNCLRNPMKK